MVLVATEGIDLDYATATLEDGLALIIEVGW